MTYWREARRPPRQIASRRRRRTLIDLAVTALFVALAAWLAYSAGLAA